MKVLTVDKVTKNFGGLTAVLDVSLYLDKNELVGLIGPNGAGKTTLFNLLTGVNSVTSGEMAILKDGQWLSIANKKPYVIANLGITRTFQNIRLFKKLSALDNVKIAGHKLADYGLVSALGRLPRFYRDEETLEQRAMELLRVVGLADKAAILADNLPYGEQRRLEIARALATDPAILFLDEPAAGMNPMETTQLTDLIRQIRDSFNLTILLIEHDMSVVMNVCERIYVLDYGSIIAQGKPEDIKNDQRVIDAYLGGDI